MKKRFIPLILSLVLVFGAFIGGSACSDKDRESDTKPVLIADFEDISECTQSMIFYNDFGKLSITRDEKFVTHGTGAAKINAMGDTAGSPALEIVIPENERDLSALQVITFDAYNDTDSEYTINVYFRLAPSVGTSAALGPASGLKTQSAQVVLPIQKSVIASPSFDISLLNVGYDMTGVYAIGFEFKKVGQFYQGKNDIYIDNLCIKKYKTAPEKIDVSLSENEICSFDKLWQKAVCYPTAYTNVPNYEIKTSVNTDVRYVKKGKSLKVELPEGWQNIEPEGWPYLKFPAKYISLVNLSKYSKDESLGVWVYKEGKGALSVTMRLWGENEELDRFLGKGFNLKDGWNHLTWSIGEINDGLDYLKDTTNIRFEFGYVYGDTTLYFDEFMVERNG